MSGTDILVVELVTEELPPKALRKLGDSFAAMLADGLRTRGFLTGASVVTSYATPRRLAVSISEVAANATVPATALALLPINVAFSANGTPTEALAKALRSKTGFDRLELVPPERIERRNDGKLERLYYIEPPIGVRLRSALQEAFDEAIAKLPIPKVMSYAAASGYWNDEKFVRPAHSLLALHGGDIVQVTALGLDAGKTTLGHRFLSRGTIDVEQAGAYESKLQAEGKVIPSFDARRRAIETGLAKLAQGDTPIAPDALLDEVTSLVEWPVVYAGTFDPAFLAVPQECLILTMQLNQKYFALTGPDGAMRARFLVVSNLATQDPAAIVAGNERVLRARLADAKFFYDQDRKQRLDARLPKLRAIVFHNKLGTQAERMDRLQFIARAIAPAVGADPALADRAAMLAKADLVTDMVGEFPELQGTMGRYYAKHDGEPDAIANAIAQHYRPRFAGDALPEGPVARTVALADKLETLAGMFGVGQVPTGDKDPFGLRRAGLGVLRILIEQKVDLPLDGAIAAAFKAFDAVPALKPAPIELEAFLLDRLRGYLRDRGATANQVEALLARRPSTLASLPDRLAAVQAFESLPEAAALAAANKRIVNILKKSGAEAATKVDATRLVEGAERDLHRAFATLGPAVDASLAAGDYAAALKSLATAKPAVDRYFDEVMVMDDDPAVRANRLALLAGVSATMNRVADISKL